MKKLLQFEEARQIVKDAARARMVGRETIALEEALGRVLADPIMSPIDVPPFANSAMDGFVLRAEDTSEANEDGPATLKIIDESRAGSPAIQPVVEGTAIRISTGAVVPEGADCVVRVEDTSEEEGNVLVKKVARKGQDIRFPGEDIRCDEVVLESGVSIGPADLGVLSSIGMDSVRCRCRPQVNLLATGDELAMPNEKLRKGQIYSSNAFSVPAQIEQAGAECLSVAAVPDEHDATVRAISGALKCNLVVVCGGVSVGEHDHVKHAFAELEIDEEFWRVAIKPGKPTWFGCKGETLVVGLPGNPVSAMVVFHLLVRPALHALQGMQSPDVCASAILDETVKKKPGRMEAVRCSLRTADDGWHAKPTKQQGSHILTSMLGADALALIPAKSGDVEAGARVDITLL